jgi:hypothetical protein
MAEEIAVAPGGELSEESDVHIMASAGRIAPDALGVKPSTKKTGVSKCWISGVVAAEMMRWKEHERRF